VGRGREGGWKGGRNLSSKVKMHRYMRIEKRNLSSKVKMLVKMTSMM
jgi:hypothetical protein